jgi:arylsulfatase A-like enzyme
MFIVALRHRILLYLACAGFCLLGACRPAQVSEEQLPNVIFIMADDLGYGEVGSYGQTKIQTPNLDRLAAQGMRFTQFYSGNPVCAPSRATLLRGRHTGHTYVRSNYELGGFRDEEEHGQLPLRPGTKTIGTMLQRAGYATGVIGKWGLGGPASTGLPSKQGFDFFYGYLDQKQAHNHYPTHLWKRTDQGMVWDTLSNDYFFPHQRLDSVPQDHSAYTQYQGADYAPDLMHEKSLDYIRKRQKEPFFLYLAYTIPHVSLQVPDAELSQYDFEDAPYLGQAGYLPHPQPLEAYAGMISRMDRYVGEVVDLLDDLGLAENTLLIFTSDNGPTYAGGVDYAFFDSNGPLRGLKGSTYEGGIRVPFVARWPGRIAPGTTSDQIGALWDVLPTLAEVTGATPPDRLDGVSLLPAMLEEEPLSERPPLYWEYFGLCEGQQALRMGRWKAVRFGVHANQEAQVELYDLEIDPGEQHNVAAQHPEVVRRLWQQMQQAHTPPVSERWRIPQSESVPPIAESTPAHPCLPWVDEKSPNGGT